MFLVYIIYTACVIMQIRSNTPKNLLKILTVDSKHCVSVNFGEVETDSAGETTCLAEKCAGDRLFFFGNVTTEMGGPQSLKAGRLPYSEKNIAHLSEYIYIYVLYIILIFIYTSIYNISCIFFKITIN